MSKQGTKPCGGFSSNGRVVPHSMSFGNAEKRLGNAGDTSEAGTRPRVRGAASVSGRSDAADCAGAWAADEVIRWCSILGHRESLRFQFSITAPFATTITITCAALHTPSSASARVSLYPLTPCIPIATACWCHRQLVAITARIRDTAVDSTTHSRCASGSPALSRSLS